MQKRTPEATITSGAVYSHITPLKHPRTQELDIVNDVLFPVLTSFFDSLKSTCKCTNCLRKKKPLVRWKAENELLDVKT